MEQMNCLAQLPVGKFSLFMQFVYTGIRAATMSASRLSPTGSEQFFRGGGTGGGLAQCGMLA